MKQRSYTLSLRQFWVWNANIFRVFIDLSPWAIFCWTELWGLVYSLGLYIVNQSWYYNWLWIKEALAEASSLLFSEQIKPNFSISSAAFSGNRSSAGEFADASTCKESPLASDPPGQSPPSWNSLADVGSSTKNILIHLLSLFPVSAR